MKARTLGVIFITAAILVLLPLAVGPQTQNIFGKMLIAGIFATGLGFLYGQSGLLSFGHAAYFGTGAIVSMQLMVAVEGGGVSFPTPFIPLVGGVAGGLLAAVAGAVATRRTGSYFSLITLAIAELIHVVSLQWRSVFGGESGLTSMRMPWAGFEFGTALEVYYCILAWFALCLLVTWAITKTAFGQIALAIRENEERVGFLGIGAYKYKVIVFIISGALSGVAGGLLTLSSESATYALFAPAVSLEVVFHTFIGGTAFFAGPLVAAAALTYLPYLLSGWTRLWPLYQGVLFMVLMYYAPGGLSGVAAALQPRKFLMLATSPALIMRVGIIVILIAVFVFAAESTNALLASEQGRFTLLRWVSPKALVLGCWILGGIVIAACIAGLRRTGMPSGTGLGA
jgi:branched-chain amino acid transport system permease protein